MESSSLSAEVIAIGLPVGSYSSKIEFDKKNEWIKKKKSMIRLTIEVEKKKEKIVTAISKFVKASHVLQASLWEFACQHIT